MAIKQARILRSDGRTVCIAAVADTPLTRLRGLLGRASLAAGEGMFIKPAPSIHTLFMRFAIDAVFVDGDLRVVGVEAALRPWRVAGRRGARAVLELPAGAAAAAGVRVGERLTVASAGA
jgi:uncharacterized membrane protein (UPF0127 family)